MHWLKNLKNRIRFKEPLNIHTTLRIGGPADVWIEPNDAAELKEALCFCVKKHLPYLVIGRGSNILFSDKGFRGVVISLKSDAFTKIKIKGDIIFCGAGLLLEKAIKEVQKKGLGGLECFSGIPASIGGALVTNAGTPTNSIGNLVRRVAVMDQKGKTRLLQRRQLKFAYRKSNLSKYIVLEAEFKLVKMSPQKIKRNIITFYNQKKRTQDLSARSAGCIFKNPAHRLTAAQMIEACGLKNRVHGAAEISSRHANYIVNRGNAKACDILYLINVAQDAVKKKFGIHLEPEIKIVN